MEKQNSVNEKQNVTNEKKRKITQLSIEEENLLLFFRQDLKYGEARVIVKNGQPVNAWYVLKNVKLD